MWKGVEVEFDVSSREAQSWLLFDTMWVRNAGANHASYKSLHGSALHKDNRIKHTIPRIPRKIALKTNVCNDIGRPLKISGEELDWTSSVSRFLKKYIRRQ